jgi:glucokinase
LSLWREDLTPLPKDLVATEIFDHALAGDSLAQKVLNRSAQTLAYAIYNLAVVLNCPLFVLGGSVGMHPALWNLTRDILAQRDKRVQPKLLRSTLGPDAQVNGAICLAIEAAGSRVLTS